MGQALWLLEVATRELMLFAAVGLLIGGIDDVAVDLLFFARRMWRGVDAGPPLREAPAIPARRIAIFVPTWQEAAVIGPMLATLLARLRAEQLRVYVAAYPNDAETIAIVDRLSQDDERVRLVLNPRPGPSTKADNLNALWRAMRAADLVDGVATRFVVLHDAEDVVHRDELRVFSALIDRHDVIQLPVRPLARDGIQLVAGTYGDSFAEAHAKSLVIRTALGAGMPLAGVGCAIAVEALAAIARARGGDPFDASSLVEDYEIGLRLSELRFRSAFVRAREEAGEGIVAIGEFFPDTLGAAIRQKARWMAGIALSGWDRTGWARPGAFVDHWMRMRDRRALLAVLVLAAAYISALLYGFVTVVQRWTGLAPRTSISPDGVLLTINLALLCWRMAMRAGFTWLVYGWRDARWSPLRFFVSNAIDLVAATLALRRYVATLSGAPPIWDKTRHEFPDLVGEPAR